MRVLVDTTIWSEVFRRKNPSSVYTAALGRLIEQDRVCIIGPIRQEILSGIANAGSFEKVRRRLRDFPDLPIRTEDFEKAAEFYNKCRSHGIQGSHIDLLICAMAHTYDLALYTSDADFHHYSRYVPLHFFRSE